MTPLDGKATYQARQKRGPRISINALKRTRREASSCFANTSAARRLARSVRRHHEDMREIHRGDSVTRGLVGAAIAWCLTCALIVPGTSLSQGQEPPHRIARVGFVDPESPANHLHGVEGFWQRLRELGWVEGQNLQIEARTADGRIDRLPALMNELVTRKIDVLVTYSTPGAVAAKNATSTIPIVIATMGDPVGTGLAVSLAHPGGNLTGLSHGYADIGGKWLELLRETVPRLSTVAVITNPDHPMNRLQAKALEALASTQGIEVQILEVRAPDDLEGAFKQAARRAQAVLVLPDPSLLARKRRLVRLATAHRLPDMHTVRDFVDAGGLMAYGPNATAMFRRTAEYVDKILRGATPASLPIEQPTQYELIINLKAAKALGLIIPNSILLRADEVIK